jgi:hypothetical protein
MTEFLARTLNNQFLPNSHVKYIINTYTELMIYASIIHYKVFIYYYVIIINCILNIYMLEVCGVGREP